MTEPDRDALVAQLAALVGHLTIPERVEVESLLQALVKRHRIDPEWEVEFRRQEREFAWQSSEIAAGRGRLVTLSNGHTVFAHMDDRTDDEIRAEWEGPNDD